MLLLSILKKEIRRLEEALEAKAAVNTRLIEVRYGKDLLSHPVNTPVNTKSFSTTQFLVLCPVWI